MTHDVIVMTLGSLSLDLDGGGGARRWCGGDGLSGVRRRWRERGRGKKIFSHVYRTNSKWIGVNYNSFV